MSPQPTPPEKRTGNERISGWRLTEVPSLYGFVVRERGKLIEYVSFEEAKRRLECLHKKVEKIKSKEKKG